MRLLRMPDSRRRRPIIGLSCLVVLAVVTAVSVHAGKAAPTAASATTDTIVYAVTSTPPDIDPNSSAQFVESELFTNTLSRLFDFKTVKRPTARTSCRARATSRSSASLATSWTVSPDSKTITINLRKGVKNHLGHTFDAKDVRYTIDRLLALKGTGHVLPRRDRDHEAVQPRA